jgi:hypothetical protein
MYAPLGKALRPSICAYSRLATPQDVYALATAKARGTPHGVFQELRVNPKVDPRFSPAGLAGLFALPHTRFGMDFSTT